jgi:SAM-dependent methyltransferase
MKELNELAYKNSISITHRHIISIVNTLIKEKLKKKHIRILDAGFGQAKLLKYLHDFLPKFNPEITFEVFGFDISDHGVQDNSFYWTAIESLKIDFPNLVWQERLKLITSDSKWPYETGYFDIVISNQVLEHVWDHNFFLHENYRVLCLRGMAIHLFPVKEVIIDWHLFLPFVHKFRNWDFTYKFISICSQLGLGKYVNELNLSEYIESHTDFIHFYCNYPTHRYFSQVVKKNGFRLTTRFSFNFYTRKFKEILGLKNKFRYNYNQSSSILSFPILKYISSVTFILEKEESYKKWLDNNKYFYK